MWRIEYRKEVRNYIYDSYPYTETIWQTIKALRHTPDGLPPANYITLAPNIFQWSVASHLVVYRRHWDQNKLDFLIIKPLDNE